MRADPEGPKGTERSSWGLGCTEVRGSRMSESEGRAWAQGQNSWLQGWAAFKAWAEVASPAAVTSIANSCLPGGMACGSHCTSADPTLPPLRQRSADHCFHNFHNVSTAQMSAPRFSCKVIVLKNESLSSAVSSPVVLCPTSFVPRTYFPLACGLLPPTSYIRISAPSAVTLCAT